MLSHGSLKGLWLSRSQGGFSASQLQVQLPLALLHRSHVKAEAHMASVYFCMGEHFPFAAGSALLLEVAQGAPAG